MRGSGQIQKHKRLLIFLIILISISFLGYFVFKIFRENKLTNFNIETQNINCVDSSEIVQYLQSLNINYFYFKSDNLENSLKKKYYCIDKISSIISYPDKLKLKIKGREGRYVIKTINALIDTNPQIILSLDQLAATQSTSEAFPPKILKEVLDNYKNATGSAMYLVDNEGMVFQEVNSDTNFPRISIFSQELKIGIGLPSDLIRKVDQVSTKLKEVDISTENLLIVGDKLIIDSKPRVIFSLNRSLDRQTASLQLILAQAKMNSVPEERDKSIESIDLRFDKPVVIYSKK